MTLDELRPIVRITWLKPGRRLTCYVAAMVEGVTYKTSREIDSSVREEVAEALCLNQLLAIINAAHRGPTLKP